MADYKTRAIEFLRSIYPYICYHLDSVCGVEDGVNEYMREHYTRHVEVCCGAARIVLITSDYVVKWDYCSDVEYIGGCEKEYQNYQMAKRYGYEYLFAESELYVLEGTTFEIMPRIEKIGREYHMTPIKELLNAAEWEWLTETGINWDLHHYNWGLKDNKPVIIDYGFSE